MSKWAYDEASARYRNLGTGRFVSSSSERAIVADFMERRSARVAGLASAVVGGSMSTAEWTKGMAAEVKAAHGCLYAFGRGGIDQVSPAEWVRVGAVVQQQGQYLRGFAADVRAGDMSADAIAARSQMYVGAAWGSYTRGIASAAGSPDLPVYPGEDCEGLTNCRCRWDIEDLGDTWACTWSAQDDPALCGVCEGHAGDWSPLVVEKPALVEAAARVLVGAGAKEFDEEAHPRDEHGQFTEGGGGSTGDGGGGARAVGTLAESSAWIAQEFGDEYMASMTQSETASLAAYQGTTYTAINRTLRGTYTDTDAAAAASREARANRNIPHIDSAIQKHALSEDVVVYRFAGSGLNERLGVPAGASSEELHGASFVDQGYVSTSTLRASAEEFASYHAGTPEQVMRIVIPMGTHVALPDPDYMDEHELLLPRGTSFTFEHQEGGGSWRAHAP